MAPTKSKTKSEPDELTRGQRTSRSFRDAAGLPPRDGDDSPKDLSGDATELATYTGPEGGYGGEEGITNQPLSHETTGEDIAPTAPDPAAIANKGFVNDLEAYGATKEEAVEAEESAESTTTEEV